MRNFTELMAIKKDFDAKFKDKDYYTFIAPVQIQTWFDFVATYILSNKSWKDLVSRGGYIYNGAEQVDIFVLLPRDFAAFASGGTPFQRDLKGFIKDEQLNYQY